MTGVRRLVTTSSTGLRISVVSLASVALCCAPAREGRTANLPVGTPFTQRPSLPDIVDFPQPCSYSQSFTPSQVDTTVLLWRFLQEVEA